MLVSTFLAGCGEGLQTFNKYGISFTVSEELKLEEYTISIEDPIFRRGSASYKEGCVISTEPNFMLLWATTIPELTKEEVRRTLTTRNIFESASGNFQAKIMGDILTQQIAGFEVTFAEMQFTLPDWEAPGITAIWYCPASERTFFLTLINKYPEREMKRFIHSFFCTSPK